MAEYQCPGCVQSGIGDECWHNEADWPIAVALAKAVNGPDATDEMFGWFADDAEAIGSSLRKLTAAPFVAVQLDVTPLDTAAFLFNGQYIATIHGTDDGSGEVFAGPLVSLPAPQEPTS